MYDFRFMTIPKKKININIIKEFLEDNMTKRIHFRTTHSNSLRKNNECWNLILPFIDTINPIAQSIIGDNFSLFKSNFNDNFYRIIKEKELGSVKHFIEEYESIVFLRDNLDLSLSLSMNFEDDKHTEIGELEYLAKFKNDIHAEKALGEICKEWLLKLPFYKNADCICSMPCSDPSNKSLPRRIVDQQEVFVNISDSVMWGSKRRSLKEAETLEIKLSILEESNLVINRKFNGKAIILLDDLYMSGLSMQYVAMKLKEAGAERIFGLSLVKSMNNTTR